MKLDNDIEIKSENTAIRRAFLSRPLRFLMKRGYLNGKIIFDWGHGLGDDMIKLRDWGWEVGGWDPGHYVTGYTTHSRPDGPQQYYDFVYCGYVLNILHKIRDRAGTVVDIHEFLPSYGAAAFAVRSAKEVERSRTNMWKRYDDGWVTSQKTFQRGFTPAELVLYLDKGGFNNIHIIKKDPIIAVAKKK